MSVVWMVTWKVVWKAAWKVARAAALSGLVLTLSGCDDPHVYGSIGVSSGYSSWGHGGWGGGIGTSISIGGRIH